MANGWATHRELSNSRSKCVAHYELLIQYEYMGEQLIENWVSRAQNALLIMSYSYTMSIWVSNSSSNWVNCAQNALLIRAVFIWVSKVIRVLLWFCFTSLCDWLKNFTPLSPPIRSKTQTNRDLLATRFPALDAGDMYLLRVLIGSLGNLCLLWLAGIITLVLVLRHSFENRSMSYSCAMSILVSNSSSNWVNRTQNVLLIMSYS